MTTETTTSYADLYRDIKASDRGMAPGSETSMWGDFVNRMRELGLDVHEPADQVVDADEAQWWRDAYEAFEADPQADVQDIYNGIG